MKKMIALLSISIFAAASFAFADSHMKKEAAPELRPLQKIMQARAAWMKSMGENLAAKKFEAIAKDAEALSAQAKKIGDGAPNPLAKELHLKVASLAKTTAEVAGKKDEAAVKAKLGEIKATCAECHAKIRDKK
jgi:cytochrome c556